MPLLRLGVAEGVGEADAFDRLLRDAVERLRRSDPDELVQRRHDVDHVYELTPQPTLVLDTRRPGDDHRIARAAEMAGHLLGPLERSIHRVRPAGREVI